MRGAPFSVRAAALVTAAALALHELRYMLAYGDDAGARLDAQGHAYLSFAGALATALVAAAVYQFGAALARARRHGRPEPEHASFGAAWVGAAAVLLAVYIGQESIELLGAGQAADPAAIAAGGGWVVLPLAVVLGAFVAFALRVTRAVVAAVAARARRARAPRRSIRRPRPLAIAPPRAVLLAAGGGARAPPPR
jgi:hypothetical protein